MKCNRLFAALGSLLLAVGGLFYLIYFYAFAFPVNSDNMYFVRAAEDVLKGNLLLRHWSGGFFSGLTTDILWAALLRSVVSRKVTLYLIGPLSLVLIGIVSMYLIRQLSPEKLLPGGLVVAAMIAVPVALRHPMLTVGMHNIAILVILALFLSLYELSKGKSCSASFWATGYGILLFAGVFGDGFVLYYFAIPCIIAGGLHFFSEPKQKLMFLRLGTVMISGAALVALNQMQRAGFLQLQSTGSSLISPAEVGKYVINGVDTWLQLFGFKLALLREGLAQSIFAWAGLPASFLVMGCVLSFLPSFFKQNLTIKTMLLSFIFVFGSFVLTEVTHAEPAYRYLSPAFYSGLVLTGIRINSMSLNPHGRTSWLLLLPLLIFSAGNFSFHYRSSPVIDKGLVELADSLKDRGISHVYATYWESHALNYYADDLVQAAPITAENGGIISYAWSADERWYQPAFGAQTLIVGKYKPYGLTESLLVSQLGAAEDRLELQDRIVYFYGFNLSEKIEPLGKE
ncbi:MAG: hypothetical protein GX933_04685 [Chloroflexi bacterium]|nr:hypothetical protein [Chloroflexota bacterium]